MYPANLQPPTPAPCCPGRFVLGSTALMQVALGKSEADEYKAGLSGLGEHIKGTVGLFFTKLPHEQAGGEGAGAGREGWVARGRSSELLVGAVGVGWVRRSGREGCG